jgi:hypothetical protein
MTEEDEAFNEIERRSVAKKEAVRAVMLRAEEDDDIQEYKKPWVELTDSQIEQVYFEVVKEHRGAPMPWGQVQFGKALLKKFKGVNT